MLGINENTIEQSAIATMQSLGWDYAYGKTILWAAKMNGENGQAK